MPICPTCQRALDANVRFCPHDGTALEDRAPAEAEQATVDLQLDSEPSPRPTRSLKAASRDGEESDPLLGSIFDGRYRIQARLGAGGIGVVYRAEHIQIHRTVAVKVLNPLSAQQAEYRLRFEREALAASKISHPCCVSVLDYGTHDNRPYLVMEFCEGTPLSSELKERRLEADEAIRLALQLLRALSHAHRHGIVHRDVKPDNIMLSRPEQTGTQVKLLDFGLAKNLIAGGPGSATLTQSGTVFGTPGYLSPEQAGTASSDGRSDLYSLGVVLFEMLCGRKPFELEDPLEQILAHVHTPPPRLRELRPDLSPELEKVLARTLEKLPAARFQTADELIAALEQVPELRPPETAPRAAAAPARTPVPAGRAGRRWSPRLLVAIALPLLAGAGVLVWQLGSEPEAPVTPKQAGRQRNSKPARTGQLARPLPDPGRRLAPAVPPASQPAATQPDTEEPLDDPVPAAAAPRPMRPLLTQALASLARRRTATAFRQAQRATKQKPSDPLGHLVLGHVYYDMLWYTDAVKEYERALDLDPSLREDRPMIERVIGCLARRNTAWKAGRLLERRIGAVAIPALRQAAATRRNADVRRRAAALLKTLGG